MKIKPCPFCGTIPFLEKKPLWSTHGGTTRGYFGCYEYDIHCDECGCRLPLYKNDTIYRSDKEAQQNALNDWNRRYTDVD